MSAVSSGQTDREGEREGELTPALQQLCRESDAAILVVDAGHFNEDSKTLLWERNLYDLYTHVWPMSLMSQCL